MDIAERFQAIRPNLLPNLHQGLKTRGAGQILDRFMPGKSAQSSPPAAGPVMSSLVTASKGFQSLGPNGFRHDMEAGPVTTDASGFRRPT